MIHVIEGVGKGKTSAAVGMAVRAAGHGLSVIFMQFLKNDTSGEIEILKELSAVTVVHAQSNNGWLFQMTEKQREETAKEYNNMLELALSKEAFLIVLDESIHALNAGLIEKTKLEQILDKGCDVVLTGYAAPEWLLERADYVSDIQKIKHPYDRGVQARVGIEF